MQALYSPLEADNDCQSQGGVVCVVRAGGAAGVARRYKGFARNGLSELPLTRIPVEALLIEAGQGLDEGRSLTRAKDLSPADQEVENRSFLNLLEPVVVLGSFALRYVCCLLTD